MGTSFEIQGCNAEPCLGKMFLNDFLEIRTIRSNDRKMESVESGDISVRYFIKRIANNCRNEIAVLGKLLKFVINSPRPTKSTSGKVCFLRD